MAIPTKVFGAASALLALAALLAAGARADWVTTAECKGPMGWRVRLYETDRAATGLMMKECNLTKIDRALTGLPNLNTVSIEGTNIENINPAAFHAVPELKNLWLRNNKLRELPVFDERSCANLNSLNLGMNKLRVIASAKTFSACTKLLVLNLDNNGLEVIHPKIFSALVNIQALYLDHNNIRFVPDQLFLRNDKLIHLSLSNNRITHLPPNFASSRTHAGAGLKTIFYDGNPWHCACLVELLADIHRAGALLLV